LASAAARTVSTSVRELLALRAKSFSW